MTDTTADTLTPSELRQIVEQIEHLEAERSDLNEQVKAIIAHAKASGYNTRVIKKIIAERQQNPDNLAEERALLDLYREAVGGN